MVIITSQTLHEKFSPDSHRIKIKTAAMTARRTDTFLVSQIITFCITHLLFSKCHEKNTKSFTYNTINIKIVFVLTVSCLLSRVKHLKQPPCKITQGRSELAQNRGSGNVANKPKENRLQIVIGTAKHARILSMEDTGRYLDTMQLQKLEESFRSWADTSDRSDVGVSRKRILLIFQLIRHTGARLSEVLHLDPSSDIDYKKHIVRLCKGGTESGRPCREVEISRALSNELKRILDDPEVKGAFGGILWVDPGHVRRKFYERAESIGIPRQLGTPDTIRRSRAVELLQNNMPLPVVQKILGHSTPNLAASYVEFSDDEMREVARYFVEKEGLRKTSARNAFYGKVDRIDKGDVQAVVEIISVGGYRVRGVITNHSVARLGLKRGVLVMAEIKAPWVMLYKGEEEPKTAAENLFRGTVHQIKSGKVTTEVVVGISDGTELCSIITEQSRKRLDAKVNDTLWVAFNSFAVVLHVD
jgi:molybdate transport system regulatory protein